MTVRPNTKSLPQPPITNDGTNRTTSDNAAALRGASLAFKAPHVKAKPVVSTHTEPFGALAAAKKAESETQWHTPSSSVTDSTVSIITDVKEKRDSASAGEAPLSAAVQSVLRERLRELESSRKQDTSLEISRNKHSSISPSNIAATLAATKFDSRTSHPGTPYRSRSTAMSNEFKKDSIPSAGNLRTTTRLFAQSDGNQLDGTLNVPTSRPRASRLQSQSSVGPAKSLIDLYEQKRTSSTEHNREISSRKIPNATSVIHSPKPFRPPIKNTPFTAAEPKSASRELIGLGTSTTHKSRLNNGAGTPIASESYSNKGRKGHLQDQNSPPASHDVHNTTIRNRVNRAATPPKPPPSRKTLRSGEIYTIPMTTVQLAVSDDSPPAFAPKPAVPPRPSEGRATPNEHALNSVQKSLEHAATDTATNTSQIGIRKPKPIDIPQQRLDIPSRPLHPSRTRSWVDEPPSSGDSSKRRSGRGPQAFPYMTEDSLANAIVASSLASSRASSPAISPQPPNPGRHGKHHYFRHDSHTPSPPKTGMRHTMRGPPRSDDDDESNQKRSRKNLIKKHPHKHHEADRKRWRDQLTERERKRYEGVWAANKGLHVFFSRAELHRLPPQRHSSMREAGKDLVAGPVTRDIWSRSRLPSEILQEVWDLVDGSGNGRLDREEFVVGMWLIDQSLKGRKLPIKVSESVWESVRRLGGVKAPKRRK